MVVEMSGIQGRGALEMFDFGSDLWNIPASAAHMPRILESSECTSDVFSAFSSVVNLCRCEVRTHGCGWYMLVLARCGQKQTRSQESNREYMEEVNCCICQGLRMCRRNFQQL